MRFPLIASGLLLASQAFAATPAEDTVRQALAQIAPGVKIDAAQESAVPGFYEAIAGGEFVYVSKDGRYLLNGSAFDVAAKRDLTQISRGKVRKAALDRIGPDKRIEFAPLAPMTSKHTVTVFTDVDCPFCRRFHEQIAQYNAKGITVDYLFFPLSIHPGADKKAEAVWCSQDRPSAFTKAMAGQDPGKATCPNPVAELTQLAQALGIGGTPTMLAADGTMIPGYLTLPPGKPEKGLPAIVMPHGGPAARDEWGFDWLAQFFAARGYAVLQPNFRGSSGYGDSWFKKNGFQSWKTAIGDVNDGGKWLIQQGIARADQLAILGWSYGGYAALQSSVLDPDLFKAIVAIAPVTDLETLRTEARNYTNFPQVDAFIGKGEHVREGSPARNAGRIKAPVLLFHGDKDLNVGVGESRSMASKLKNAGKQVEFVEFKGLDHQLDDDTARTAMLSKADAFLRSSMGL